MQGCNPKDGSSGKVIHLILILFMPGVVPAGTLNDPFTVSPGKIAAGET